MLVSLEGRSLSIPMVAGADMEVRISNDEQFLTLGGAFSGKDPSKVDRSAAYAARWVAKSLVSSKLCERVMIQVAYGIGISEPVSIYVDSYGTAAEGETDETLIKIVKKNFDLRPGMIIKDFDLRRPIFT